MMYLIKYKYYITGTILLIYLTVQFFLWYEPFDSSVWGNVADWIMILVTSLTAVYLIKTFNSQQQITRIEQANFRFQFLPDLQPTLVKNHISITIQKNPIVDLITYHNKRNRFNYVNLYHHYGEKNSRDQLMAGDSFMIHRDIEELRKANDSGLLGIHDEIYIFFLDSQNNLYEQTLVYDWNSSNTRLRIAKYILTVTDKTQFHFEVSKIAVERQLVSNMFT